MEEDFADDLDVGGGEGFWEEGAEDDAAVGGFAGDDF